MQRKQNRLIQLKRLKLLRLLVSPYKNWKITRTYNQYLATNDRLRLKQLEKTHVGERCFIIGNGPSLRSEDLGKLRQEFTFAANRIYEIFEQTSWRPNVYLAIDEDFVCAEEQKINSVPCEVRLLPFLHYKGQLGKRNFDEKTILVWMGPKSFEIEKVAPWADKSAHIPDDVSLGFSEGRTVTFDAIQMAIYMGFKEIYLLGVDFSYSRIINENGEVQTVNGVTDYFNKKTYNTTLQYYVPTKHAYEASREYCDTHGITIRNATRGGKLEAFERVDFDSLFKNEATKH